MKLSIVSIFCDTDYKLLPGLISNIREKVKVSYELIFIDNREKYKYEEIIVPEYVKIYSKGKNVYQFEARRYAVQFCSGDYIWFIDTDDSLLFVDNKLETITGEMICFSYVMKEKGLCLPSTWEDFKEACMGCNIVSVHKSKIEKQCDFWNIIGSTLWNKWIKRDLLKQVITDIPEDLIIVASEDILYSALCYDKIEQVTLCKDSIYVYNLNDSKANNKYMSYDRFCHIIKGRKTSWDLFRKLTSDGEKYDNTQQSVAYFLCKLSYCNDRRNDCIEELKNHFSVKDIKNGVKHLWVDDLPKDKKDFLYETIDAL